MPPSLCSMPTPPGFLCKSRDTASLSLSSPLVSLAPACFAVCVCWRELSDSAVWHLCVRSVGGPLCKHTQTNSWPLARLLGNTIAHLQPYFTILAHGYIRAIAFAYKLHCTAKLLTENRVLESPPPPLFNIASASIWETYPYYVQRKIIQVLNEAVNEEKNGIETLFPPVSVVCFFGFALELQG